MLHEIATSGVAMAALITVVWVGMVLVAEARMRRAAIRTSTYAIHP
jgi:hypothetical protein